LRPQFGLAQTELAQALCEEDPGEVLNLAAVVRVTVWKVALTLSESSRLLGVFARLLGAWRQLAGGAKRAGETGRRVSDGRRDGSG